MLIFLLGSLILVATGYDGKKQDNSQVVDVSSTNSCSSSLSPYPIKINNAIGGVLNGSPFLCGGFGQDQDLADLKGDA